MNTKHKIRVISNDVKQNEDYYHKGCDIVYPGRCVQAFQCASSPEYTVSHSRRQ
jgi:hypothetical protein